ncbi:MAG: S1 family peptidase [Pseudomonadota bacterium]
MCTRSRYALVLFIFSSLALQVLGCAPRPSHGQGIVGLGSSRSSPRIIGGDAYAGLPAVGALTYDGAPFCSGTLIAPRLVLTAAHCLENDAPWLIRFAIGPSAWEPEAELGVVELEPHPDYDPDTLEADVGLVHLARDARVPPLPLLQRMDSSWIGVELQFVGYGMDAPYSPERVGIKREVRMPIERVAPLEIEFGGYDANICNGDSGAPALYEDSGQVQVVGVISSGDAWCERFGIATRVDPYLDFILGRELDPCGGETLAGRCDSDIVWWCEDEVVYSWDCGDDDKYCAVNAQGMADCADAPCAGETWYGRCEGQTLVWCENDRVQSQDCRELDASCELYDEEEGYYCLE